MENRITLEIVVRNDRIYVDIINERNAHLDSKAFKCWDELLPWFAKHCDRFKHVCVVSQLSKRLHDTLIEVAR